MGRTLGANQRLARSACGSGIVVGRSTRSLARFMTVRGYKMRMSYVDRQGKKTRPSHWVDVPAATRHLNGLARLKPYVARVLTSNASSSWAQFSTKSGNTAISLGKRGGKLELGLTVDVRRGRKREADIRAFFARRNILPKSDYLAANGGVPEATRIMNFPMPHDARVAAKIASDLLRKIYRLRATTTLDIRFEEHEAS